MCKLTDEVFCPIKKQKIDICECLDIQNVADDSVVEGVIDFALSQKDKNTCINCKKIIDPAL